VPVEAPVEQKPQTGADRRRSRRLDLTVPVEIAWKSPRGEDLKAEAIAHNVSEHGASLHLANGKVFPAANAEITLTNVLSKEVCQARVTRVKRLATGNMESVGVDLLAPSTKFWGLTFQLQQTTLQLLEVEKAIQAESQDVDFRVLRSLADAVEYLRDVSSIVYRWQELKVVGKNAYSMLDPLSSARVRQATNLFRDLTADIDASELTSNSEEYTALAQAVERLYERMTRGPYAYREVK
jgi:hypothetical protein